jgi:hypothetical protein
MTSNAERDSGGIFETLSLTIASSPQEILLLLLSALVVGVMSRIIEAARCARRRGREREHPRKRTEGEEKRAKPLVFDVTMRRLEVLRK